MPVDAEGSVCIMQTPQIRLSSYNDIVVNDDSFPIYYNQEASFPVFSYTCDENVADGGLAPYVNQGFTAYSPSNDTFYFAQMTYQMMQTFIPDVANPWGPSLPIRVYSHAGKLDNAFALTPVDDADEPLAETHARFNAQFIVGDGNTIFYPLSDSGTIGHELSHIYTAYHSNLIYTNQSGGINEAYSDIAGQTLEFWLSQQYPWYGFDWEIGAEVSLPTGLFAGKALRYFNNPPLDGHSIANAANFVTGMNVHHSSGVFNYSFYLMVTKYNIDIYTAYRYFSHANAAYWTPSSSFNNASCGVMQAALDTGNQGDFQKIMQAFRDVGVKCKIGFKENLTAL
jgi:pseudolysin